MQQLAPVHLARKDGQFLHVTQRKPRCTSELVRSRIIVASRLNCGLHIFQLACNTDSPSIAHANPNDGLNHKHHSWGWVVDTTPKRTCADSALHLFRLRLPDYTTFSVTLPFAHTKNASQSDTR